MDLAHDNFVSSWPQWLRWILFIPAALVCGILANLAFALFTWFGSLMAYGYISTEGWYFYIINSLLFSVVFVYVGAFVAPAHQYIVAILMTCILAALSGISLLALFLYPLEAGETIKTILGIAANIIGAIAILIHLKGEELI